MLTPSCNLLEQCTINLTGLKAIYIFLLCWNMIFFVKFSTLIYRTSIWIWSYWFCLEFNLHCFNQTSLEMAIDFLFWWFKMLLIYFKMANYSWIITFFSYSFAHSIWKSSNCSYFPVQNFTYIIFFGSWDECTNSQ